MATIVCRVQFLDDTDPFNSTNFPEPTRPPLFTFRENIPLINQISGVHRLLKAPQKLDDCALQLSHNGSYLDLESTLAEQRDELEGFQEEGGRGRKHSIILRTQLSVRVHACIEKLYNSTGRELRRALFSLKQIFQDDKDLVHEFVVAEGLTCLIKVGAEADQNYQNYILRALGQIMLYVDGMNGLISHNETVQWLYSLVGSKFRLVVKTALKLLLVFVEYTESNAALLIQAVNAVDAKKGTKFWSNVMEILDEKDGVDTELLVYAMTLINKTLAGLPDQDSYYDVVDSLEDQSLEATAQRHLSRKGTDLDLVEQFNIYEVRTKAQLPPSGRKDRRRASMGCTSEGRGLERRRSRRHSLQNNRGHASAPASPSSPYSHGSGFLSFGGPRLLSLSHISVSLACRTALGGLLTSSYRQHQESLAVEREKRRQEREERLQRIEREERNRFNRDYVEKREEARQAREERYKAVERLAAEESEREHPRMPFRGRTEITLCLSPKPGFSRSPEVSEETSEETNEETSEEPKPDKQAQPVGELDVEAQVAEVVETDVDVEFDECVREQQMERDTEDSELLSEKERQNEEVNEKDNCSASSISSTSSTLERKEREERLSRDLEAGTTCDDDSKDVNGHSDKILNNKRFMLDMLYAQSTNNNKEESLEKVENETSKCEKDIGTDVGLRDNHGSVRAVAEKFGDLVKGLGGPPEEKVSTVPSTLPPKKESDHIWDQLLSTPRELRIKEMDFTDLGDEDDMDVLDMDNLMRSGDPIAPPPPLHCTAMPPPPPLFGCPPPPPIFGKMMPPPPPFMAPSLPLPPDSLWSKLEPVKVDTSKLEQLFESKSKELPVTKKAAVDGKRQEIIVLDSKRSNAINIGLTVLPPPRTIKTAILNFDEYALNKEGIEKILTMIPTEEEKQRIQEAQLMNPDVPLGSAEQFLLTLSSITELSARLQLWAFKMDYELIEKEVAEPLQDLKEGMEQLEKNKTLRYILTTLLAIGNFLNGTNAKGFELNYLEKVPEVKDTVHKQSLLHHACAIVVEKFPDSTDLYSEIGAITRLTKVDFDQLQDNLAQMERRCKASWDHLKVIAKHEMKAALKQKMSDFLKDCAERIIILKIVHRRILNRFHAFLLFLGHPVYGIREVSIHRFSKILSEFALEYRTTRERVLQQKQKRANHRERNKTRGKMITDSGKFGSTSSEPQESHPQGLEFAENAAQHENMKAVLRNSSTGGDSTTSTLPGLRTRTRVPNNTKDPVKCTDDAADEIMERIVRSATQPPSPRTLPRERRRSRANRKSLRRTLRDGLTTEEANALGLSTSELQV
uniref:Formin homology 2 domain containing 3b n=1 Tax=Neogobius melanostomus TaxID=47308 RepID=A0A8C6SEA9_9GOBI